MAVPVSRHLWLGGGYELVQDYDAVLWTAKDTGHKPIVLSAVHAGVWYRGDSGEPGLTWAIGGLVTFANSTLSLVAAPNGIDRGTYVLDVGPDLSIGRSRNGVRIEVFVTPAWSWGRVASPAVGTSEGLSRFTYRVGVAFAVGVGA